MELKAAALIAMGLAIGIGAIGPGLGMGQAVSSAIDATARQPEAEGKVRTLMFIGLAFLEALALYALVVAFIVMGIAFPKEDKAPNPDSAPKAAQSAVVDQTAAQVK